MAKDHFFDLAEIGRIHEELVSTSFETDHSIPIQHKVLNLLRIQNAS
jgi:hypothetical protein